MSAEDAGRCVEHIARHRSGSAVVLPIVGRMRRQLTAIGIALVTAGCGTGNVQGESAATDASPSDAMESPRASVAAMASASPDPTPASTPHASVLEVGGFADVVTTDLVVRSAPGVGADSEIYGTIEHIPAYIVAGPVEADGFAWWLVAHARHDPARRAASGVGGGSREGRGGVARPAPTRVPAGTNGRRGGLVQRFDLGQLLHRRGDDSRGCAWGLRGVRVARLG